MVRRSFRIVCMIGSVVLLVTAVVSQFMHSWLQMPGLSIIIFSFGATFEGNDYPGWQAFFSHHTWWLDSLLAMPRVSKDGRGFLHIALPWWLLILTWSLLTATVFRLTRRRKVGQAFPVDSKNSG